MLSLLAAGITLRLNYAGDPEPGTRTRGRDAVWLGHAWVDGRNGRRRPRRAGPSGYAAPAIQRPVRPRGPAGPRRHPARDSAIRRRRVAARTPSIATLPGVRVQAWLGDVLATEGPTGLRLDRTPRSRAHVVALRPSGPGRGLRRRPLRPGAAALRRPRLPHPPRRPARPHAAPAAPRSRSPPTRSTRCPRCTRSRARLQRHPKWWSQAFFGQVARRVDQIAVMSYDTSMPLESLYGGYVAQQTALALEATPPGTDLLMGLPFYHEQRPRATTPAAETVTAAVRGTRLGLGRARTAAGKRFGVALYVDFAATDARLGGVPGGLGRPGHGLTATLAATPRAVRLERLEGRPGGGQEAGHVRGAERERGRRCQGLALGRVVRAVGEGDTAPCSRIALARGGGQMRGQRSRASWSSGEGGCRRPRAVLTGRGRPVSAASASTRVKSCSSVQSSKSRVADGVDRGVHGRARDGFARGEHGEGDGVHGVAEHGREAGGGGVVEGVGRSGVPQAAHSTTGRGRCPAEEAGGRGR